MRRRLALRTHQRPILSTSTTKLNSNLPLVKTAAPEKEEEQQPFVFSRNHIADGLRGCGGHKGRLG